MTGQAGGPFPADALELNRKGRLSDGQRAWLSSDPGYSRGNELVGVVTLVAIGILLLIAVGQSSAPVPRPVAGAAALGIAAAYLVYRGRPGRGSLTQDLRDDRVEAVEGPFAKRTSTTPGRSTATFYYFDINDRTFGVSKAAYEAAPEAGRVRLYVLPRSHRVMNLERLPDAPLPPGALDSSDGAKATIAAVAAGIRSHDQAERLEARATLEAMKDAIVAPATAPAEQRDPRPLAEAIVGTWRGAFGEAIFNADGSATVALPAMPSLSGRWSVDPDGRLHVEGPGLDQAADARVAGETLTLTLGGEGMSLRRVGSG